MDNAKKELLEEAIQVEINMAKLYLFFRDNFTKDKDFWGKIAEEEAGHAALLNLAKDFFDKYPKNILYDNINALKAVNKKIKSIITNYTIKKPSEKEAYEQAFRLENSAYELHYENLLESSSNEEAIKTFQKLNEDDKNHANRIRELIDKNSINR